MNEEAVDDDAFWIRRENLIPDIRRIGGLNGPLLLAAPHPVFLHNTGSLFPVATLFQTYRGLGATGSLHLQPDRAADKAVLDWIRTL